MYDLNYLVVKIGLFDEIFNDDKTTFYTSLNKYCIEDSYLYKSLTY